MKKWVKDHSSIAALARLALTIVLAFLVIRQTDRLQSETQRFAWLPYHAPVLLNVTTGEYGELQVYDNDPYKAGELAARQKDGFAMISQPAGVMAYRDANAHTCHVTLPGTPATSLPSGRAETGPAQAYILADTYDPENVRVFPIEDGAQYEIRDYTIQIYVDDAGKTNILVTGTLKVA